MMKRSVDFNDADLIKELERVLNEHAAQILKVNGIALTSYDIYSDGMIFEFRVRTRFKEFSDIWKVGDCLTDDAGDTAMIVWDGDNYILMPTTAGNSNSFNINCDFGSEETLANLQNTYGSIWRKMED